jgi:hypothetical protein
LPGQRGCDKFRPTRVYPEGIYRLEYTRHYTDIIHGAPKVALWFRVVTMGEYFHTQLARYYHVKSVGKNRTFKAGWHSDLVREYVRVLGERPNRRDRVPITRYRGLYILGRVRTVEKDRKQIELPEPARYTVNSEN